MPDVLQRSLKKIMDTGGVQVLLQCSKRMVWLINFLVVHKLYVQYVFLFLTHSFVCKRIMLFEEAFFRCLYHKTFLVIVIKAFKREKLQRIYYVSVVFYFYLFYRGEFLKFYFSFSFLTFCCSLNKHCLQLIYMQVWLGFLPDFGINQFVKY